MFLCNKENVKIRIIRKKEISYHFFFHDKLDHPSDSNKPHLKTFEVSKTSKV